MAFLKDLEPPFFLGIDPGIKGGTIAICTENPKSDVVFAPFRSSEDIIEFLSNRIELKQVSHVLLEEIPRLPGLVTTYAMFEVARALLSWCGVSHNSVRPQEWQKQCLEEFYNAKILKSDTKAQAQRKRKQRSVKWCNARFPHVKITKTQHDLADALILARYAIKKYKQL